MLSLSSVEEWAVHAGAMAVAELMSRKLRELSPKTPVRVLGPVRAAYGRIGGRYRWRILMKCKNTAEIRGFIREVLTESGKLKEMRRVLITADMNGDAGV